MLDKLVLVCRSNKSIYLGQVFNELDKLVIKLKNTYKNNIIFFNNNVRCSFSNLGLLTIRNHT